VSEVAGNAVRRKSTTDKDEALEDSTVRTWLTNLSKESGHRQASSIFRSKQNRTEPHTNTTV
jgi:hypothetical protein